MDESRPFSEELSPEVKAWREDLDECWTREAETINKEHREAGIAFELSEEARAAYAGLRTVEEMRRAMG